MSVAAHLIGVLLPPFGFLLLIILVGVLSLRRAPVLAAAACVGASATLLLGTPLAAGLLRTSLAARVEQPDGIARAIVILGADQRRSGPRTDVGPMTLERLRAGARLARATGLPLLVTAGPLSATSPPLAELMAASLVQDFRLDVRWVEPRAADTRQNAAFSAALLAKDGIDAAYVVSHAWHLPRAQAAFLRSGLRPLPAPVRHERGPVGHASDLVPRPDYLGESWVMLREWAGLLVYRLRDGPVPALPPARQ